MLLTRCKIETCESGIIGVVVLMARLDLHASEQVTAPSNRNF